MATIQGSAAATRSDAAVLSAVAAAEGDPTLGASGAQEHHRHQHHQQYYQHDRQYPSYSQHHQPQKQHGRVDTLPSISSFHNTPQTLHPHPHPHTSISLPPPSQFSSGPPSSFHMASQAQPPSHHPPPPPSAQQQQQSQQMGMPQPGYYPPPHSQAMMPQPAASGQHSQSPSQYGPPPPGYDQGYGRMALPQGARMQGQRAPGKEIKRRTKTGCLTCRKRRIKCDEGHPQCKNCIKSKRECAGYDPMFKPHPQGNQSIRPAGSSASTSSPPATASHPPPPYAPPQGGQSLPPPTVTGPGITGVLPQPTAIDPTLQQHHAHPLAPPPDKFGAGIDDPGHPKLIAKPTRMEELTNIGNGREPPIWQRSDPITDADRVDAEALFKHIFAYGLDLFFETRWFGKRGWTHLLNDTKLLEKIVLLHSRMGFAPNTVEWDHSLSLEGHIIWDLIMLCRHVSTSIKTTNTTDAAQDLEDGSNVHELAARTQIFENLVTNQHLDPSEVLPLSPTSGSGESVDPASKERTNERPDRMQTFWHHLSKFCSLRESSATEGGQEGEKRASVALEIEACLSAMRSVLDQNEPRDILYSVAIARHLLRPEAVEAQRSVRTNDESDPATQLHIARSFIYQETRIGTSPIMTRIARIVIRSWLPVV